MPVQQPVQQHVLNWLYSVLTSEYHDVNRTYNDLAQCLTRYPTLSPRTDVHTFFNGASALLLHLSGTLPVSFRGQTYRFPVSLWIPHAYPREPPLVYVRPTETMMIRPGQHVDPQGQVYHPYLVGWAEFWDKSTLHDFLAILCEVFAKEPPVISRQQSGSAQSFQSRPPPPPLPPQVSASNLNSQRPISREEIHPPRLPPKNPAQKSRESPALSQQASRAPPSRYDSAPPLPSEAQRHGVPGHSQSSSQLQSGQLQIEAGSVTAAHRIPPAPPSQQHNAYLPSAWQASGPLSIPDRVPGQWQSAGLQHSGRQPHVEQWRGPAQNSQIKPVAATIPPPPDLLDEPLTLNLPDRSAVAPPPIPPNPEKDALLAQLAQTLAAMRQRSRQQNDSSMAGLHAQRNAILSTVPIIQSEMGHLTQLSNLLTSNTAILHDALHRADAVIEGSRSHPAPNIDDLLVAPTVVANQLYTLVAEERALGDAIFMLSRAVERGRISPAVFAKMTRSLAREWYLKKALVRKIGLGMGLSM